MNQTTDRDVAANDCPPPSPAQLLYARVMRGGMITGLCLLAITFTLYVSGIMKPYVPLDDLAQYYSLPVEEYLEQANVEPGWKSFFNIQHADSLCFVGLVFLACLAIICQLAILPLLLKRRDKAYAAMAIVQIFILLLAASGVIGS